MGHGYNTVFGYGFLVSKKSFINQVLDRSDSDHEEYALDATKEYIRNQFGFYIHQEGQNDFNDKWLFFSLEEVQICHDARGAAGSFDKIDFDAIKKKIDQCKVDKMKNELDRMNIKYREPDFYLFSYEGS